MLTVRGTFSFPLLPTVGPMKFTRNSIAAAIAIVCTLSAATAAVAFNLGGAETGVPSPAGKLAAVTTTQIAPPPTPSTIYVDQTVIVPVPAPTTVAVEPVVDTAPPADPGVSPDRSSSPAPAASSDPVVVADPAPRFDDRGDDDRGGEDFEYEGQDDDD